MKCRASNEGAVCAGIAMLTATSIAGVSGLTSN